MWPVSYTHLDVYKRQVVGLAAALALQGEPEAVSGALALAPVSYTHLDVYKRQVLRSLRCAAWIHRPKP